jgi:dTDP-4-dehydrorhamnose reductase
MLRLMKERTELKVVSDQVGSPTYAADLADAIMQMIISLENGNKKYGIYHYSNEGVISWYDFALAIRNMTGASCEVLPQPSSDYPTPAKRPGYSVMDTSLDGKRFWCIPAKMGEEFRPCLAKFS